MRILFLVRSLDLGGAERQLVALARGLHARGHDVAVAVFYGGGRFEPELRDAGIPVHDLHKRGRWETGRFVARLAATVRRLRPDVLHAYMHANIFASAVKPLARGVKVVWGIRTASPSMHAYGNVGWLYPKLERAAALLADGIVVNSTAARRQSIAAGLPGDRISVVPNGIDAGAFRPDPAGRTAYRAKWGVPERAPLVGVVARLDPVKDHANFVRAAARVGAARPDARFVCVSDSDHPREQERLLALAADLGVAGRLTFVDEGKVSSAIYSALDVFVLSSEPGESFPNVIGEAMACGTPVVATDSGDAAEVVGDTGRIVPTRDPAALSDAILAVVARIEAGGARPGDAARARIEQEFSPEKLAIRTERALAAMLRARGGAA